MRTYEFTKELKNSTDHSLVVMEYFRQLGHEVVDKSEDMVAQKIEGYDFTIDGQTCEFKSDRYIHKTGNVAFEIISDLERAQIGCMVTTKAKWLLYYDNVGKVLHRMLMQELKAAVFDGPPAFETLRVPNIRKNGTKANTGLFIKLNLKWVKTLPALSYSTYDIGKWLEEQKTEPELLEAS